MPFYSGKDPIRQYKKYWTIQPFVYPSIHPSIQPFSIPAFNHTCVTGVCWNLYHMAGTPWLGWFNSIQHKDKQPFTVTLTPILPNVTIHPIKQQKQLTTPKNKQKNPPIFNNWDNYLHSGSTVHWKTNDQGIVFIKNKEIKILDRCNYPTSIRIQCASLWLKSVLV